MASKRKQKAADYHVKTREWDQNFRMLGLPRPQDAFPDLLQRSRQVNLGVTPVFQNGAKDAIESFQLKPSHLLPRKDFQAYPDGGPKPQWVDTAEKMDSLIENLKSCSEITIDLEGHNHRTYTDYICLIQIGTWEFGDFLIDPFQLRHEITTSLKPLLESTELLKIGDGINNDVTWLQKNFGIFMAGAVDTQILHEVLTGQSSIGFNDMVSIYLPKAKQFLNNETMSDWRLRMGQGMTTDQEQYATNDVHILLRVCDKMKDTICDEDKEMTKLKVAANLTKEKLLQISRHLTERPNPIKNYQELAERELNYVSRRNSTKLNGAEKEIFIALVEWRDLLARILDEKPMFVVSSFTLMRLAKLHSPDIGIIKDSLVGVDKRISDRDSSKSQQAGVIKNIIDSSGAYITECRNLECHNCLQTGHGPAWACPFPKNKGNYKTWYNKPENAGFKEKQFNRRWNNMVAKAGEDMAKKAILRTKHESSSTS